MDRYWGKVAANIKGKSYQSNDDLARDVAQALSSLARLPSQNRALDRTVITDPQGGTTLGVGDPSATHLSSSLVSKPQTGLPTKVGGGLETRLISRVEMRTRTTPARVTSNASAGDTTIPVVVAGIEPHQASDNVTPSKVVDDPFPPASGQTYSATVTGRPLSSVALGTTPPVAGQIIPVTVSEQWRTDTVATKRGNKWHMNVVRSEKANSAVTCTGWRSSSDPTVEFCVTSTIAVWEWTLGHALTIDLTPYQTGQTVSDTTRWRIITVQFGLSIFPEWFNQWDIPGIGYYFGTCTSGGDMVGMPASIPWPSLGDNEVDQASVALITGCPYDDTRLVWENIYEHNDFTPIW
jgi:hypothetical protein